MKNKSWIEGFVIGTVLAAAAGVYADSLPHTFTDGETTSAAQMNANFQALADSLACPATMVRVGSTCLDREAQGGAGSWMEAMTACEGAGRRLAKGSEIIAAFNADHITVPANAVQYIDAMIPAFSGEPFTVSRIWLRSDGVFEETEPVHATASTNATYRCAR